MSDRLALYALKGGMETFFLNAQKMFLIPTGQPGRRYASLTFIFRTASAKFGLKIHRVDASKGSDWKERRIKHESKWQHLFGKTTAAPRNVHFSPVAPAGLAEPRFGPRLRCQIPQHVHEPGCLKGGRPMGNSMAGKLFFVPVPQGECLGQQIPPAPGYRE